MKKTYKPRQPLPFNEGSLKKNINANILQEDELIKISHTKQGQKQLFDYYYPRMYSVAIRYLKNNEDVQDILSESFIRVFRKIEHFRLQGVGSLYRWVKTIVINESLRHINKKRKPYFDIDIDNIDLEYQDDFEENVDIEFFMELVNSLPDGYRIVFLLYVVEGYSHREIANKLDISISTSKTQLMKARGLIVKKLKKVENYEFI